MHMDMNSFQEKITVWTGVEASPHRFGGIEFTLGGTEIGHIHNNGMVDIPFNMKIRDELIAEGKVLHHHLLHDTGWITFYIRSETDVQAAVWLFRLSYLFYAARGNKRALVGDGLNLEAELAALGMSQPLQAIVDGLVLRR
ncbi:MAG: luciferase family protein [Chloroflexota bacterium]